ncbi:MAG: glycosyltransferase family 4 protein [Lentisphaerae bacterium]|nr:glycosyltransferase family 4 protein [Lentisphaerota bacterium]
MEFLFIKGSSPRDVRISKYVSCLSSIGHEISYWGWDRSSQKPIDERLKECRFVFSGGGFGRKTLFFYPIWIFKLFFCLLCDSKLGEREIIAVNFDAALPTCLACLIRRKKFTYEILDEFALSYNFPGILKCVIRVIDHWIIRRAKLLIHVDHNRITYAKDACVVIENAPEDYWQGKERGYDAIGRIFAVTGSLSMGRGIGSICKFAEACPDVSLLVVGRFVDEKAKRCVSSLKNVICHEYIKQKDLFGMMEKCCGVFSLYDPSLEINRLAASNKVYDAMMMGIPVITNKEVLNAEYIAKNGIGIVLDYNYNDTWKILANKDFVNQAIAIGRVGRKLYLEKFQFKAMVEQRLLPALQNVKAK